MTESEVDTSRTTVRTYVPAYQREQWDAHADELDMSRSEYVRTMVQAGRGAFGEGSNESDETADAAKPEKHPSPDATPGGDGLENRVIDALAESDYLSWEELLEELTDDIEQRLEDTLQDLQSAGRVQYSGRNGGYTLDE